MKRTLAALLVLASAGALAETPAPSIVEDIASEEHRLANGESVLFFFAPVLAAALGWPRPARGHLERDRNHCPNLPCVSG